MFVSNNFNDFVNETSIKGGPRMSPKVIIFTHWDRVTHICDSKRTIIGSDNGFWPGRRQGIIWDYAWSLLIEHLKTNFSDP